MVQVSDAHSRCDQSQAGLGWSRTNGGAGGEQRLAPVEERGACGTLCQMREEDVSCDLARITPRHVGLDIPGVY